MWTCGIKTFKKRESCCYKLHSSFRFLGWLHDPVHSIVSIENIFTFVCILVTVSTTVRKFWALLFSSGSLCCSDFVNMDSSWKNLLVYFSSNAPICVSMLAVL
jgi:hypothetical protein